MYSHGSLQKLFFEYEIESSDPRSHRENATKDERITALLRALEKKCESAGTDNLILELTEKFLRKDSVGWRTEHAALVTALKLDGFDFVGEKLVATTPGVVALAPQISGLESELEDKGFEVAVTHYRQAVDNFTKGNWEAANSQTRSFLEDLFIVLCEQRCGKKFSDPNGALDHLRNKGHIDEGEWSMFRAFWKGIQDKGSHHGLSAEHEALYRLHVATATARYLLEKFK